MMDVVLFDEIDHGFGLRGMTERASTGDGHFRIEKGERLGGIRLVFAQPIAQLGHES